MYHFQTLAALLLLTSSVVTTVSARPCINQPSDFSAESPDTCEYFSLKRGHELVRVHDAVGVQALRVEIRATNKVNLTVFEPYGYDTLKQQNLTSFKWSDAPLLSAGALAIDQVTETDYGLLVIGSLNISTLIVVISASDPTTEVSGVVWLDGYVDSSALVVSGVDLKVLAGAVLFGVAMFVFLHVLIRVCGCVSYSLPEPSDEEEDEHLD